MNEKYYNLVMAGKITWDQLHEMLVKFNTAMAAAQAEIETIEKGEKGVHGSFAGWSTIRSKTKGAVTKNNGLVVEQYHTGEPDNLRLITIIKHSASGYEEIYDSPIVFNPATSRGSKLEFEVQGAITFYKRNTYNGLFCIATEEEDSEREKRKDNQKLEQQSDTNLPPCPKCGKALVEKNGKSGPFYACPGYPECKFTVNP